MRKEFIDSIKFGFGFYIGFNIARTIKKIIRDNM